MSDIEQIICGNCKKVIENEDDIGLEACMGGPMYYLCDECNKISGEFIFRRTLQVMAEKAEKE